MDFIIFASWQLAGASMPLISLLLAYQMLPLIGREATTMPKKQKQVVFAILTT